MAADPQDLDEASQQAGQTERPKPRRDYTLAYLITAICALVLILLVVHSLALNHMGATKDGAESGTLKLVTIVLSINVGGVLASTLKDDNKLAIAVIGLLGTIVGSAIQ